MSGKTRIIKDVILMSCVTLKVVALRLIPADLASGARLAAKNEGQALGEKTFIHWITLSTGIRALNSSKDKITNPKIKLFLFSFNQRNHVLF